MKRVSYFHNHTSFYDENHHPNIFTIILFILFIVVQLTVIIAIDGEKIDIFNYNNYKKNIVTPAPSGKNPPCEYQYNMEVFFISVLTRLIIFT